MVKAAFIGLAAVMLSIPFKQGKSEYSLLITLAACVLLGIMALDRLRDIIGVIEELESYMTTGKTYIFILLKMLGITFVAEFSSQLCQDAGFGAIARQIDLLGKLAVLGVSLPVVVALLETVGSFLH